MSYCIGFVCNIGFCVMKFQKVISVILYSVSSQCFAFADIISVLNVEDVLIGIKDMPSIIWKC